MIYYFNNFKKIFMVLTCILLPLIISGCGKNANVSSSYAENSKDSILLIVNGEKVYKKDFLNIKENYVDTDYTDTELLEGMVLELLVLQEANYYSVSVTDKEIDKKIDGLKNLNEIYYNKAMEKYKTEEKLKDAFRYKILYDKIKQKVNSAFLKNLELSSEVLMQRTNDYVSSQDVAAGDKDKFTQDVLHTYEDITSEALSEAYFSAWQYSLAHDSDIQYIDYNESILFSNLDLFLDIDDREIVDQHLNKRNNLEPIDIKAAQQLFGNFIYIPNSFSDTNSGTEIYGIDNYVENLKCLLLKFENNGTSVIISAIVSPRKGYSGSSDEITKRTIDDKNVMEFYLRDVGVQYTIVSEYDYNTMNDILMSFVSFKIEE